VSKIRCVSITKEQDQWLREHSISLSRYVQKKLREDISRKHKDEGYSILEYD